MLHARLFAETESFRNHHFQSTRSGLAPIIKDSPKDPKIYAYLDGHPKLDRPLTVQFCANDPDELLEAARYVQPFCDAVDLNLGCPQGIARSGHYGAFLQEDWDLIHRLINKLHKHLDVPVTAKIRVLETKEKTLKYAQTILDAGASILTVHGRQREQKGHNTGLADWSVIRYLRDNLPADTVIFANGNILRHTDIETCLARTGADGVMSAEGNLCDPTIFASPPPPGTSDRAYWRDRNGRGGYRVDAVFRKYMSIIYKYVLEQPEPERKPLFLPSDPPAANSDTRAPEPPSDEPPSDEPPRKKQRRGNSKRITSPNLLAMRAHLFHFLRPLVSIHTNVRDALARAKTGDISAFERVLSLAEEAVKEGLLEYDHNPTKYEDESQKNAEGALETSDITSHESSLQAVRACKRPWWICQPYVRPLPKEAVEKGSLTLSRKEKAKLEKAIPEDGSDSRAVAIQEGTSGREKLDVDDGMEKAELPVQAVICG